MSKKIKIPLIIILIITVLFFIPYCILFNTSYFNRINIQDNNNNNFNYNNDIANIGSDLIQIDNKLYYNYVNGECLKYGTYEIGSYITRRVNWDGFSVSPQNIRLSEVYKGKILDSWAKSDSYFIDSEGINPFIEDGKYINGDIIIEYFDFSNKTYKEYITIKNPEKYILQPSFTVIGETIYFYSKDCSLYLYDGESIKLVADIKDLESRDFYLQTKGYISNSQIYYQGYIDNKLYIYCYNTERKKIIYKFCIDDVPNAENGVSNLIADGDDVYFLADFNKLYHINLKENTIEKLFETKGVITANYYNQKLYIGVEKYLDENGLYTLDLSNNKKVQKLNTKETCGVYILDDEWIYFTDQNEKVYRITPDGKSIEKVFG